MKKSLIIVESPTKIKTLKKFFGPNFVFESSLGHIRDLPSNEFGIDIDNNFEPKYIVMPEKKQVIDRLKKAAKECETIYLSPDPDREGEAIAWHIAQILPDNANIKRVSFNSITKDAVLRALDHPSTIDTALVSAQQARRLLDRMVGYKISPILNRRIQRGRDGYLSAGRVQSVALKMVVDREKEIEAFKPVEYWNLASVLNSQKEDRPFRAALYSVDGKKVEREPVEGKDVFLVGDEATANELRQRLEKASYRVTRVEKKEKKRNPVPPFITSTLQQEASRHHGFSSSRTMKIAQELYEGIDMGNQGAEGLITYMRTDSVRVAPEVLPEAREWIKVNYGPEYLPASPNQYSSKKNSQDAHEAIRPTNFNHPPDAIKSFLSRDQFLLYSLIWKRFIASQMNPAIYDTISADIETDVNLILRATGSTIKFQGFLAVYEERRDEDDKNDEARILPVLEEGMVLALVKVTADQAFTRPPPRFSEASLVKELEKSGIGRPSTYASIMNKIQSRDYTVKEGNRLKPTELGRIIAQMLETNFSQIMDLSFTATMEDELELVAANKKDWHVLLSEFWQQFWPTVQTAEKELVVPKVDTDIDCPKCGSKLQKIWFKSKYFYGCSRYPDCDYSAPLEEFDFNKEDYAEDFDWDQPCPLCKKEMKIRHSRYGAFLGCSQYPECKGIVNIPKKGEKIIPEEDLPGCPAIGCPGKLVARKSRFGKIFYSCSTFPECNVIVNALEDIPKKYANHPRTPYEKKGRKGKAVGKAGKKEAAPKTKKKSATKAKTPRKMPALKLSPELSAVTGQSEMSRPQVIKAVWDYIKANGLQDEGNKRLIKPDEALTKVFGGPETIDMMKITGLVGKHLHKI